MYEFWYDYMKPKYGDNVKSCYKDTYSFVKHIKTELQMMLKRDLIHQIMKSIGHYQQERIQK